MKKGLQFPGIISPIITPFTTSEQVDETLFRKEVRHLLDAGVHGLSPGGSTGEGAALRDEELVRMIQMAKEENKRKVPIMAGVIRTSTQAAITTALAAKKAGADALMITPVFYNVLVPDAAGNTDFYRRISEQVGLPIVIYNVVPQNEISSEVFSALLDIPNVVGIKQSVGGIMAMYDMVISCGQRGMIYSATDEMIFSCFAAGADGAISAILTMFPRLCVKMWDLSRAGKHAEALKIQDRLYPVWKAVRGPQFPSRMKAAMRILGREAGHSRSPMTGVDEALKVRLAGLLSGIRDE
jgi:1-pyrroline-4-hydroxy-2-carboxylate deaminase